MKIWFAEQDVIDAACVYVAETYQVPIERLNAELRYDEGIGIRGTVEDREHSRLFDLSERDLVDGAVLYLSNYHSFDPRRLTVELQFDENEGVTAVVEKVEVSG
ncbi:hypothetical protein SD70_04365 [Gordoniibacillus kamchatkensis]|uniref:DUF2653 domain-containing protein n=1 Tax=Gordoniibacillus kamchatkensis TaxID=1590651 RepID=A0ABR5ALL6_9BACL|nr:DUF2653 family protein [Paenibacillus sp. VKM B-2647]KIL41855.1 hypothetical protein SD70_04365 [Paenibacillus sp. VKM B-2647]